ncbi:hypothetical protein DPMN_062168 [Dreissena polymorpha]|uniref:Uncharacterized protein n=1 Tax=Dreissena polymorpha TaxID=45954 RepID=A0A9D4C8C2_DREPO|nr:hypothetical protein DPMN_062168 [Dreissena polymorpha]
MALRTEEYIIGTNLLTKFHKDRKINVASRLLTRFYYSLISHVFQPTGIIFELVQDIIGMNLLTMFHEDRTVNVASRKKCPPLESHFFQANIIIFELIQDIIKTNLLTKFHEDWTINVASRVLTTIYGKCPAPGGHVLKATQTIFKLIQDIIGTNLLTKFHDDRKINSLLTRFYYSHIMKIAPPPMNLLTEKNAPPLGGHVFQANITIFELIEDIIKTHLLTIFHQDWTINMASKVLTRKNAPPPGGRVFQPTGIIFEVTLSRARTTDPWGPGEKS